MFTTYIVSLIIYTGYLLKQINFFYFLKYEFVNNIQTVALHVSVYDWQYENMRIDKFN